MTGTFELGAVLYFVPLVVSYFVTDRLLSYYYTDSWWKEPQDVEINHED